MMRLIRTHKMRRTMTACANASDTPLTARNSIITAKPPVSNFYINTVKMFVHNVCMLTKYRRSSFRICPSLPIQQIQGQVRVLWAV